jgi:hypothetical protein
MRQPPNRDLWLGILVSDASHEGGALRIDRFSGEEPYGISSLAHLLYTLAEILAR